MNAAAPLSALNPDRLHARIVVLGETWAELDGAASLLEETRKTLLAKLMRDSLMKGQGERETAALAHPDYREHVGKMVAARTAATKARIAYDAARTWIDICRSLESTRRAEMTLR